MKLVLLVSFLCRGEFIDDDKRFFGRIGDFPGGHAWLMIVKGEKKAKKCSSGGEGQS